MRILYCFFLFCCAHNIQGQSLKFSVHLGDQAQKKVWVYGEGVEVRLAGDAEKLQLIIKNTSSEYLVVKSNDYSLIHRTGIKDKLCGPMLKLGPGEKESITLTICEKDRKMGLFGLYRSYDSRKAFEEGSLFLADKSFKLSLGESFVDFYTGN